MKLSDDFEEKNTGLPLIYMGIGVALFIATVVGAVVLSNRKPQKAPEELSAGTQSTESAVDGESGESAAAESETDSLISGSKLTSDDLDFWHMYDEDQKSETEKEMEESETAAKDDPSTDGKHTKLIAEDGTEEWVSINPYLTKNKYDFTGLVYQYPVMKYYEDSEKHSKLGISLNQDDGDVNFSRLKKAGVEFAMIRLGSRGYGSGNIMSDEKFYEYVKGASEAGMEIGVTFFSQAVSAEEAVEEANRVIEGIQGFTINYPIVFDMEYIKNDTARVQGISKEQKTEAATAFLQTIKQAGYKTMIYGDKEWLIRKIDLSKLIEYDIWLSEETDIPDYPYKFVMWEYSKKAKIDGMSEPASLSICMINYSAK